MNLNIDSSWNSYLNEEFHKPYFRLLEAFIKNEYTSFTCYPKRSDLFKAFEYSKFASTRVVIIGQDPYHGAHQANGLCFSVNSGVAHPPSLKNIFKELQNDLNVSYPSNGDLSPWAKQGVLLLNTSLSVRSGLPGSHQNRGWETFTDQVIRVVNKEKYKVVFLLWGAYAKKKKALIDGRRHFILESGHPSPLSANRGYWFGNHHFSTTNSLLEQDGQLPIDWCLN